MKRIISILVCVAILASLSSCAFVKDLMTRSVNLLEREKEFVFEDLSITLTTSFMTLDFINDEFSFIWGDGNVTVMGIEVDVGEEMIKEVSTEDYAAVYASELEGVSEDDIGDLNGIPTILYSVDNGDGVFTYLICFYETSDSFWVVMLGSEEDIYEEEYDNICKYAASVQISQ